MIIKSQSFSLLVDLYLLSVTFLNDSCFFPTSDWTGRLERAGFGCFPSSCQKLEDPDAGKDWIKNNRNVSYIIFIFYNIICFGKVYSYSTLIAYWLEMWKLVTYTHFFLGIVTWNFLLSDYYRILYSLLKKQLTFSQVNGQSEFGKCFETAEYWIEALSEKGVLSINLAKLFT